MTWTIDWRIESRKVGVGPLNLHTIDAHRVDSDGSGPTLLLLHGLGSHRDSWLPLVPHLSFAERVICPDNRGHGQSDWSRDGYWLHDYATDARGLLDQLGVGAVDVVGHSHGARVAALMAPMLGDRLTSVALLDTAPDDGTGAARERALVTISAPLGAAALSSEDQLRAFLRDDHPEFTDEQLEIRARSLFRLNWAGVLVPRTDPEVFWLLGDERKREVEEVWAGLRATSAPALVVRGSNSVVCHETQGRAIVNALQHGTYREVPLGHFMHHEAPEVVAGVLNEFHSAATPQVQCSSPSSN